MIVNPDVDVYAKAQNQRKTLQKTKKNSNLTEKQILKYKLSGGPHFRLILPERAVPDPVNYNTNHRRLLLHIELRWLSKGNCLKRIMELFEPLNEFLKNKSEMIILIITDSKGYVNYIVDIFEKFYSLKNQLQRANATLFYTKAKIFGFVTFLSCAVCQKAMCNSWVK